MKESAPFQLSTDVARVEVNQSRQVLLPLSLARRNGFDGEVALTLVGATPASLGLTIKSFPKGKSAELVRLFIPRFERAGTVTLYWKTQAPVAYRRNPEAQERAKTAQAAAAKEAAETAALAKNASSELDRATKNQNQSADALKKAKAQLAAAEAAAKSAAQARQKAATRVAETAAKSQAAAARKAAADRELAQATTAAAPKTLTDFAPSTPILLTVKPAPIDLKAVVSGGGALKKGGASP